MERKDQTESTINVLENFTVKRKAFIDSCCVDVAAFSFDGLRQATCARLALRGRKAFPGKATSAAGEEKRAALRKRAAAAPAKEHPATC